MTSLDSARRALLAGKLTNSRCRMHLISSSTVRRRLHRSFTRAPCLQWLKGILSVTLLQRPPLHLLVRQLHQVEHFRCCPCTFLLVCALAASIASQYQFLTHVQDLLPTDFSGVNRGSGASPMRATAAAVQTASAPSAPANSDYSPLTQGLQVVLSAIAPHEHCELAPWRICISGSLHTFTGLGCVWRRSIACISGHLKFGCS